MNERPTWNHISRDLNKNEAGIKLIFNYSTRMIEENLTIATGNTLAFCGHGLGHTGREGFRLTSSRFTKWIFARGTAITRPIENMRCSR